MTRDDLAAGIVGLLLGFAVGALGGIAAALLLLPA